MGYVHQILILLHLLLETAALLLLQQVKIVGCVKQGLDETFPGAECRDLGSHCGADPGADHQDELRGPLGLQAGQEFPVAHAGQSNTINSTPENPVSSVRVVKSIAT